MLTTTASLFGAFWMPACVKSAPIEGRVEIMPDQGQLLGLNMFIDESTTRFELTGPDYSWFAFGFDTTTMFGYSLILEGTDAARTAVEQNLRGIGDPGVPQSTQNISVLDVLHDSANNLTTIVLERASHTGDPNDPDFTTTMTSLDLIWAYDPFASPTSPSPNLGYHSFGRGFATITFSSVPEPSSAALLALGAGAAIIVFTRQRRLHLRVTAV